MEIGEFCKHVGRKTADGDGVPSAENRQNFSPKLPFCLAG